MKASFLFLISLVGIFTLSLKSSDQVQAFDAPDCYKLLDFELARQGFGGFFDPKGEKNVPEGVSGGVQSTFEQIRTSEQNYVDKERLHKKKLPTPFEETPEGSILRVQVDNLRNRFHPYDIVFLAMGGRFSHTLDYRYLQTDLRVYLENKKVEAIRTSLTVSHDFRNLPLLLEVDSQCDISKFHFLNHDDHKYQKPTRTFFAAACGTLDRIETAAPLVTLSATSSASEYCRAAGGRPTVTGGCYCQRDPNRAISPPHEVCNPSEARRQERRALAMIQDSSPEKFEGESFDQIDYLKLSKACQVFEKHFPKKNRR